MGRINVGRVILGGIVAGIVGNILGYLVDGVLLASQWAASMQALGKADFTTNQIIAFNVLGLVSGVIGVWLYAAIRPRYGSGPKTAILAGLAMWAVGTLLPNAAFMSIVGLFPQNLAILTTLAGIVVSSVAIVAGASLYTESAETARTMSARA